MTVPQLESILPTITLNLAVLVHCFMNGIWSSWLFLLLLPPLPWVLRHVASMSISAVEVSLPARDILPISPLASKSCANVHSLDFRSLANNSSSIGAIFPCGVQNGPRSGKWICTSLDRGLEQILVVDRDLDCWR